MLTVHIYVHMEMVYTCVCVYASPLIEQHDAQESYIAYSSRNPQSYVYSFDRNSAALLNYGRNKCIVRFYYVGPLNTDGHLIYVDMRITYGINVFVHARGNMVFIYMEC